MITPGGNPLSQANRLMLSKEGRAVQLEELLQKLQILPCSEEIYQAWHRIQPFVLETPVLKFSAINKIADCELFFKCENFQRTGSFKLRGAFNAVYSLDDTQASCGVVTHSSGNHGAAIASAAQQRGIKAYIVMPETAPEVKKRMVCASGAHVHYCKPDVASRSETASRIAADTGAEIIHSSNNYSVIAGQGTIALEFLKHVNNLDAVIVPVGGGGLLAGTALAVAAISPETMVIGVEPEVIPYATQSLAKGEIDCTAQGSSLADGLMMPPGHLTFCAMQNLVHKIYTVSEDQIRFAMNFFWRELKMIIEPSAAVVPALLFANRGLFQGKRVGAVLSGANIDLTKLATIIDS